MQLSIITINLNNAAGLLKTVESVLNQTYSDFEYIIIDGGSTDNSLAVIKDAEKEIAYWISEPDKGIYNAMNKGIKIAKGEYCLFLNSGDFLCSKETVERVFQMQPDSEIIYGDVLLTERHSPKTLLQKHPSELSFMTFNVGGICHQAAFIKRKLFGEYGLYDESYKIVSDWKFFIDTIIFSNVKYQHINQVISIYNRDGFGNQNTKAGIAEMKMVLNNRFPELVLKDLEIYKNNFSDFSFLVEIKKHRVAFFFLKVFKRVVRLFVR